MSRIKRIKLGTVIKLVVIAGLFFGRGVYSMGLLALNPRA